MNNVSSPKSKLLRPGTRIPFNSNELSVKMIFAILDLLSPPEATVVDAFGGTMTTALAALGTGRSCIVLEWSSEIYSAAVQKLRVLMPGSNMAPSLENIDIDVQNIEDDQSPFECNYVSFATVDSIVSTLDAAPTRNTGSADGQMR